MVSSKCMMAGGQEEAEAFGAGRDWSEWRWYGVRELLVRYRVVIGV